MYLKDKKAINLREGFEGGELGGVRGRIVRREGHTILFQIKIFFSGWCSSVVELSSVQIRSVQFRTVQFRLFTFKSSLCIAFFHGALKV